MQYQQSKFNNPNKYHDNEIWNFVEEHKKASVFLTSTLKEWRETNPFDRPHIDMHISTHKSHLELKKYQRGLSESIRKANNFKFKQYLKVNWVKTKLIKQEVSKTKQPGKGKGIYGPWTGLSTGNEVSVVRCDRKNNKINNQVDEEKLYYHNRFEVLSEEVIIDDVFFECDDISVTITSSEKPLLTKQLIQGNPPLGCGLSGKEFADIVNEHLKLLDLDKLHQPERNKEESKDHYFEEEEVKIDPKKYIVDIAYDLKDEIERMTNKVKYLEYVCDHPEYVKEDSEEVGSVGESDNEIETFRFDEVDDLDVEDDDYDFND